MTDRFRVLGIDVGSTLAGFAVIDGNMKWEFSTLVKLEGDLHDRLVQWKREVNRAVDEWLPAIVAVENPLAARNIRTAEILARFVGVAIAEARYTRCLTLEYRAREHRKISVGEGILTVRYPKERKRMRNLLLKQVNFEVNRASMLDSNDPNILDALSVAVAGLKEYRRGQRD